MKNSYLWLAWKKKQWKRCRKMYQVCPKRNQTFEIAGKSAESTLRLLNACSSGFRQQTAICRVSLWPLVGELQPPKCAHVQAVCCISAKVTTNEVEEQRVRVKFCYRLGKTFTETFQLLNKAKHTGKTVRVALSAMTSLSILNKAVCWLVTIPSLDDPPHQQMVTMWREFVLFSWKSSFNCSRTSWRSGHQHRIMASYCEWQTWDASCPCKIRAAFVECRSETPLLK